MNDANGILNVSAADKSTGKQNKVVCQEREKGKFETRKRDKRKKFTGTFG